MQLQSLSAIGLLEVSKYELQNETVSRLSLLKSLADDKNWKMVCYIPFSSSPCGAFHIDFPFTRDFLKNNFH